MVTNVLYNTTNQSGPTGQPIFAYPNQVVIGVVPNQITVVGTARGDLECGDQPQEP